MLSGDEKQAWNDIERYYHATEAEEPARVGPHSTYLWKRDAPGLDDMPAAAVAGVWITIFLVIFGAPLAGLAVGGATALGWALWRWWTQRVPAGPAAAGDLGSGGSRPGGRPRTALGRRTDRPEEGWR